MSFFTQPYNFFGHTFALFPAWMAGLAQLKGYRTIICQAVGSIALSASSFLLRSLTCYCTFRFVLFF